MNEMTMSQFIKKVRLGKEAKSLIPLDFGVGWPILSIKSDNLCVTFPFFKSVLQPDDKTMLYPIAFTLTALWPTGLIVGFSNLKYDDIYMDIDITKPVGTFRHDAIKHLDKEAYIQKREELYRQYDTLIQSLYNDEPYNPDLEREFRENLNMMMEPSLAKYYQLIDPQFFNRFF